MHAVDVERNGGSRSPGLCLRPSPNYGVPKAVDVVGWRGFKMEGGEVAVVGLSMLGASSVRYLVRSIGMARWPMGRGESEQGKVRYGSMRSGREGG